MKEYTSFDRVAAALEHKEPDRIPLDFGGAEVVSINIHTMRKLRRHLGMTEDVHGFDRFMWRGVKSFRSEWSLICVTHNLMKLWRIAKACWN